MKLPNLDLDLHVELNHFSEDVGIIFGPLPYIILGGSSATSPSTGTACGPERANVPWQLRPEI